MTYWTPSTGYSYMPPSYTDAPKATVAPSSPSLLPTDLDNATTNPSQQPSTSTAPNPTLDPLDPATETSFSDALFMHSLALTNRFGDEFMDENPLRGEPGAFVFTNTKNAVDERNKVAESAAAAAAAAAEVKAEPLTQPPSVVGTPMPVDGRKGSVAPKDREKERRKERRKSRGLTSPVTPGGNGLG